MRVHRGVYAVGHAALSREGRWMAAVLACGKDALLSHDSAAACWAISSLREAGCHVTAAHRLRLGIPVTSPARTLADLSQIMGEEQFERVAREAQFRGLFHEASVRDALTRRPSRVLRELLDDLNPTQSKLEDAFLRLYRRRGIPTPNAQVRDGRRTPGRRIPPHTRSRPTARSPTRCSSRAGRSCASPPGT